MKKILALLLAATLCAALCACGKTAQTATETTTTAAAVTETETEAPETTMETTAVEESLPQLSGIASDADACWYEIESDEKDYTDEGGGENHYSYAIPAFNFDSADASRINAEMETVCRQYVDEMQQSEESAASLMTKAVSYDACLNGDIASIVIQAETTVDITDYYAYNLNVATGAQATGAELIAAVGLTEDAFLTAAQAAVSDKFAELYGATTGNDFYDEQYAKTMSADAFSLNMPMYLNESGQLCIIGTVYAMAGADSYNYPLVLG